MTARLGLGLSIGLLLLLGSSTHGRTATGLRADSLYSGPGELSAASAVAATPPCSLLSCETWHWRGVGRPGTSCNFLCTSGETLRIAFGGGMRAAKFSSAVERRAVFSDTTARAEWVEANVRTIIDEIGTAVVGHDYSNGVARDLGEELMIGSPAESLIIEVLIANAAASIRPGVVPRDYSPAERVRLAADGLVAQRARRTQPPPKRRESYAPYRAFLGVVPPCSLLECREVHYRGSGDDLARTHECRFRCAWGETLRVGFGRKHVASLTSGMIRARHTDSTRYYAWMDSLRRAADADIGPAVVWGVFTRRFLTRYQAIELAIGSEAESLLIDLLNANAAPRFPADGYGLKITDVELLRWAADRLSAQRARPPSGGR